MVPVVLYPSLLSRPTTARRRSVATAFLQSATCAEARAVNVEGDASPIRCCDSAVFV